MDEGNLSDATLVLIGHGSTVNASSCGPTLQHADEIRRRGVFQQVLVAFWKQTPTIRDALQEARGRRVVVVPVFIGEGYFTGEVIPRELGLSKPPGATGSAWRRRALGDGQLFYAEPVGTHDSMTRILLARAESVVATHPFPAAPTPAETSLFLAGHGTDRNENSRRTVEAQAARIRNLSRYASVHAVFMEEEPRIDACYDLAATTNVVMVPFFISDGLHTRVDIPVLLGDPAELVQERLEAGCPTWRNPTERRGRRVWFSGAVGTEPGLADVILERARGVLKLK